MPLASSLKGITAICGIRTEQKLPWLCACRCNGDLDDNLTQVTVRLDLSLAMPALLKKSTLVFTFSALARLARTAHLSLPHGVKVFRINQPVMPDFGSLQTL